jgi:transcriptional regulator of acetoin/glycerol metabolism
LSLMMTNIIGAYGRRRNQDQVRAAAPYSSYRCSLVRRFADVDLDISSPSSGQPARLCAARPAAPKAIAAKFQALGSGEMPNTIRHLSGLLRHPTATRRSRPLLCPPCVAQAERSTSSQFIHYRTGAFGGQSHQNSTYEEPTGHIVLRR